MDLSTKPMGKPISYPYPYTWVWVFTGTGTGFSEIPLGYPCHSLVIHVFLQQFIQVHLQVGHGTGNPGVSPGLPITLAKPVPASQVWVFGR